ncbi:AAA family ATPase [Sphingomonadaceae bacterium OTU29THOMA1]|nr:AAA family ATPase [Sphingomonadaceae bacterium OTU29THOMA1]
MHRIALLGLSGVGKSTLLRALTGKIAFMHLQASDLIKAEQAYRHSQPQSSEALRTGAVLENQALLIAGFHRAAERATAPIVFDGHSVIDSGDGLIEIPGEFFAALDLAAISFLQADPATIAARQSHDSDRQRPLRDEATLAEHQERAITVARRAADAIGCPFQLLISDDIGIIERLIIGT